MSRSRRLSAAAVCCGILAFAPAAAAQPASDPAGVRAAGMGNAFVAVADDASAVYWNPAGLATGAYFSLVLDRNALESTPSVAEPAFRRSFLLFAVSTPALGLSYYRARVLSAAPAAQPADGRNQGGAPVQLAAIVTNNAGVTLVQSLGAGVAIGTTLRLVRGTAAAADGIERTPAEALDRADAIAGTGRTTFDADIGAMATAGIVHLGLTVRNVRRASFPLDGGGRIRIPRQARAGVSLSASRDWTLAVDADLTKAKGPAGTWRDAAIGTEGHIASRAWIRGGLRWNTAGGHGRGTAPAVSVGGSLLLTRSLMIDAQATGGSASAGRGWGIGTRVAF